MIDRQEFADELILRENIRKVIKLILEKHRREDKERLLEEHQLRNIIRKLVITEASSVSDEIPHRSTGINVLRDLLKKVIPQMEIAYKQLTTSEEQRVSFRAHVLKALKNILAPSQALAAINEQEGIDIAIEDDTPNLGDEAFIDIEGATAEEGEEEEEEDEFGIPGEEPTGRNKAEQFVDKIDGLVQSEYDSLGADEDREEFYDYLITNVKLYADKFEDELTSQLEEPTTPEYEDAAAEADESPATEEVPAEEGEEEFEF
tara:strand:- start:371 stop:1153 length:783 start_codon:yes stop_codon:yes gene_type:complete